MMRHGSKPLTDPRWCRPHDVVCRRARLYRRRRSKVAMPARDHDGVVGLSKSCARWWNRIAMRHFLMVDVR